jgi:hypothetical protein
VVAGGFLAVCTVALSARGKVIAALSLFRAASEPVLLAWRRPS